MAHGLPTEHFRPKTLSAYDCTCRVIRVRLVHVDKREREVPRSVLAGCCVCVVTSHVCVSLRVILVQKVVRVMMGCQGMQ